MAKHKRHPKDKGTDIKRDSKPDESMVDEITFAPFLHLPFLSYFFSLFAGWRCCTHNKRFLQEIRPFLFPRILFYFRLVWKEERKKERKKKQLCQWEIIRWINIDESSGTSGDGGGGSGGGCETLATRRTKEKSYFSSLFILAVFMFVLTLGPKFHIIIFSTCFFYQTSTTRHFGLYPRRVWATSSTSQQRGMRLSSFFPFFF